MTPEEFLADNSVNVPYRKGCGVLVSMESALKAIQMARKENPTPGECVTITKARYQELLDYERIALWALNSIVVASLPEMEMKAEKLKELSNDAKCKAVQAAFQEALKGKE